MIVRIETKVRLHLWLFMYSEPKNRIFTGWSNIIYLYKIQHNIDFHNEFIIPRKYPPGYIFSNFPSTIVIAFTLCA